MEGDDEGEYDLRHYRVRRGRGHTARRIVAFLMLICPIVDLLATVFPVREVVIDGLAVLKIVKHCNDNLPSMVS
jgi:hypothetical protein